MKVLFVINPKSGSGQIQRLEALIDRHTQENQLQHCIYKMQGDTVEQDLRRVIDDFKPDTVAAAGGDGTINLMAKLLCNSPIKLLILPMGSANGMAKELNMGYRLDLILDLLESGETKAIDLIRINGNICIHLADVGLNARIVKRFEKDPKRGILTYAKHLFYEIFVLKHYRFQITYGEQSKRVKAVSLTFANATQYGTGAVINPEGELDDHKFELIVIKPFPNIKLLSIAWKIFTGKLQTSEYVEVIRVDTVHVTSSRKTTLQIDGEVFGKVTDIRADVIPGALQVIVPAK